MMSILNYGKTCIGLMINYLSFCSRCTVFDEFDEKFIKNHLFDYKKDDRGILSKFVKKSTFWN
jgi:hypothetical protein